MKADIQISGEYSKLFNGHKRAGELGAQGKVGEELFIQPAMQDFPTLL